MEKNDKTNMNNPDIFSTRRILIVEDDEGLNNLVQKSLHRAGFHCLGVLTGTDAIEKVKQDTELVLLVDQLLPDMDGTDLVRQLIDINCVVPFVAMTGHGDEKIAVEMMKLGARDYLTKGIDLPDILPIVFKRLFKELATEAKLAKAEKNFNDNQILYKSLLESSKAVTYEVDLDSLEFTYISPQIFEITGYPANVWKDFDFWANTLHSDDRKFCVNFCMTETQKGRDHEFEYRMIKADDQILWIKDLVSLVKDGDKPIALRGFLIDITKQKNMEAQLQRTQKMEAIGNLSGGIAHDFNNILFPIVGMSELLMEDLAVGSTEHHYATEILKAATRGSDLVKQILAFSRQSEHKIIPTKIQSVLTEVLKLMRSTIPSNIEISNDIQSNCGLVMADPTQVHQVAMNLLTNAFHAVEKQNGNIFIELKEVELGQGGLQDSFLSPGKYARMSIEDTGEGIHPVVLDKIFEPYFTTKEQGKGTGLGLAVVYGIVKKHHGDIKVHSEIGKGTEFIVFFPIVDKPVQVETPKKAVEAMGNNESILLVDDDQAVLLLVTTLLERMGYKVTAFLESKKALEEFQSNPDQYDLVLTDMTMPKMTGDVLAKNILAIQPDMPIIICTGFSERMNDEKVKAIGIKDLLMKPIVKSEMAKVIRKVLDESNDDNTF
ncbi:MAG: response regulator [Desulfobacteraceae bacterium]|nr:response regulator [Desulfobacteraceae bacterium]